LGRKRKEQGGKGKVYSMMDLQKDPIKSNSGIGDPGNAEKPVD
jgi:hypothetical protein